MSGADFRPFAPPLAPARARALPWITVVAGSLVTALPPCGLLMLLAWRLLSPFALRPWAAAPLGFADDLVSGQPLGSAVLLWSLCFLAIELVEQRLISRDFRLDWLIATVAVAACLFAGRLVAMPLAIALDQPIAAQLAAAALLFPVATRIAAFVDAKRSRP